MKFPKLAILFLLLAAWSSGVAPSFAFSLTAISPRLANFEVRTDAAVVLVFNASIDANTLNGGAVHLEMRATGGAVGADISLSTTTVANDTVTLTPLATLPFGKACRVVIGAGLRDAGGGSFDGVFFGGHDWFVPNVPSDLERPVWDPSNFTGVFVNSNVLLGFNPIDPESTDPTQPQFSPGINCTGAWKISTGRPEIIIADVDNGLSTFHNTELADRFFLNKGELPMPQNGAEPCAAYDCNGDGRFSASDYANDPRVSHEGRDYIDPQDLIDAFADGADADNNGYVDDISGWDFFRNANTPFGVSQFREGVHSNQISEAAVAQADNGEGNKPGACPDCTILSVRVTDGLIADLDGIAAGARYAADMGARVLMVALGGLDYNADAEETFIELEEQGVVTIAASGDTMGFHNLYPAAGEGAISVKGVLPIPPVPLDGLFTLDVISFIESYCTNYGPRIDHTVSTGACTSESVGLDGGLAGLLFSYALDRGIDLSAYEVRQILNMTADDIKAHCFTMTPGGCKEGWDLHWGYGRVNAERALDRLGVPDLGIIEAIPPDVRITSPAWFTTLDPSVETLTVEGHVSARGRPFQYHVEVAMGGEPDDAEFVEIGSGSGTATDGVLATADLSTILDLVALRQPATSPWDKLLTIRVRAMWETETDAEILGEARRAIAVNIDDDPATGLMPGMPMKLGRSGEASPVLFDLDGDADGALEIILATSESLVEVYKRDPATGTFDMAPGFPVEIPPGALYPDGHVGTPAVADLFGDGVPVIVTATDGGRVYAIWPDGNDHADGPFLPGFPVSADPRPNDSSFNFGHGNGFMSAPVLADLDGDGVLEIIAASYDQQVYAWRPSDADHDGLADRMPGWPVLLRSTADLVDPLLVCDDATPMQIITTPAVAILDPNSDDPDIAAHPAMIAGTVETCESTGIATSRLYAVFHDGMEHAGGPFLPGWPAAIPAPLGDSMPIPPLTMGTGSSPAVLVRGGAAYVGTGTFFFLPLVVKYEGGATDNWMLWSSFNIADSAAGLWGRMVEGGDPWYFTPTGGILNSTDGYFWPLTFNVLGWRFGNWAGEGFRKRVDDIQFLHNPIMADLNGDGWQEVIAGSMGYRLFAWNVVGDSPAGWPKYTQNAHLGSAAVGDVDGDGLFEVISHTHEGNLFGWETAGTACRSSGINAEWWKFHHDEWNTGLAGQDTLPPSVPTDLRVYFTDDPDVFEVRVTAPGDDWHCGTAAAYELRYVTTAPASGDLRDAFTAATPVGTPDPVLGGTELRFTVSAPGAAAFAMRAVDEGGLLGHISPFIAPTTAPPADDDTADDDAGDDDSVDDDTTPEPTASDDDDENTGACCGK